MEVESQERALVFVPTLKRGSEREREEYALYAFTAFSGCVGCEHFMV